MKNVLLFLLSFIVINTAFAQYQIGQDLVGQQANTYSRNTNSISTDGTRIAIGIGNGGSGKAQIYEEVNSIWVQVGQDIVGDAVGNNFGGCISISGDGKRVVIGAPYNSGNGLYHSGHAKVFEEVNGSWIQIGQDIEGEAALDFSGSGVSISTDGKRVAVGAFGNKDNGSYSGHVRMYEEVNGNWIQIGQDLDGYGVNDRSGRYISTSADGKRVAIGVPFNDGFGNKKIEGKYGFMKR